MNTGDDQAVHNATRKEDDTLPPGGVHALHFLHPRNEVYMLLVTSSTVLVLLSVTAISVWSSRGHRDEAYRWLAVYAMDVLCLVLSLWTFRLIRLCVHFLLLYRAPRLAQVLVNPDDIASTVDD